MGMKGKQTVILGNVVISPLLKAFTTFGEAINDAKSKLEKDGAIQRFEYTYELFWKTLKRILEAKGIIVNSPRDVFRESAKLDLIKDPKRWFEFLKLRNLTVHTYNEDFAAELFSKLKHIHQEMSSVLEKIQQL